MVEHTVSEILGRLGLTRAQLIYSSGGHFYLLLPNTEAANSVVAEAKKKINRWFYDKFGLTLYMAIAGKECSALEMMKNASAVIDGLAVELAGQKAARYADDEEMLRQMFCPAAGKERLRECSVCGTSSSEIESRLELGECCDTCRKLLEFRRSLAGDREYSVTKSPDGPGGDEGVWAMDYRL
ncbi:MAG: hypothetical protein N3A57_05950 [Negativicutes bacterium]|nr:hypothetical protein [Negativicutes bacterium]